MFNYYLVDMETVTLCITHSLDLTVTCFTCLREPMRIISLHVFHGQIVKRLCKLCEAGLR